MKKPHSEPALSLRSLSTSALAAVLIPAFLLGSGRASAAWGFVIGAVLSLFSLFSLTVLVPFLIRPNAPRYSGGLLILTLFMKMPLYMVGLYAATHLPGVSLLAVVAGIALAPATIVLKTIGDLVAPRRVEEDPRAETEPITAPEIPTALEPEIYSPRAPRPQPAGPVYEGG